MFAWVAAVVLITVLGGIVWWVIGPEARRDAARGTGRGRLAFGDEQQRSAATQHWVSASAMRWSPTSQAPRAS